MEEQINPGKWSLNEWNAVLHTSSALSKTSEKIDFISGQFLNISYRENTLSGSQKKPEIFIINLEEVDCFTYLDYVEAMRLSNSFKAFNENLKKVRYQKGVVNFENRNHFFINWRENNSDFVEDVTASVGISEQVDKELNNRGDDTWYVPGIAAKTVTIHYISSTNIFDAMDKLKTGDYIGIYSDKPGLDVSHVGVLIRDNDRIVFRHASQIYQKVVDEDFKEYIKNKPGIIVLRAKR